MAEAAYEPIDDDRYRATGYTIGPWDPGHQHAGPPSALIARAVERVAAPQGLTHLGRLTVNLLRPAAVGICRVEVEANYVGRGAAHYSGRLFIDDKEIALFTALAQREQDGADPGRRRRPSAAAGAEVADRVRTVHNVFYGRKLRLCAAVVDAGRSR